MKHRLVLGLIAVLCALPLFATSPPDIPAGDDVWDTPPGGGTNTILTSADWFALCGVTVPDTGVQFKGFNIPGQGTGDTVVTRLGNAPLPSNGSSATIAIKLKDLSFVSDGTHPCSGQGLTLRAHEDTVQATGSMTITRTSSGGGTFTASVPVSVVVEAVNSSGAVVGSTYMNGVLTDQSSSPWSYQPPNGGALKAGPWYPSVDPVTHDRSRTCRFGNENAPSSHCYQNPPPCGGTGTGTGTRTGTGTLTGNSAATDIGSDDDTTIGVSPTPVEHCTLQATADTIGN
jgi:hypothetical protein